MLHGEQAPACHSRRCLHQHAAALHAQVQGCVLRSAVHTWLSYAAMPVWVIEFRLLGCYPVEQGPTLVLEASGPRSSRAAGCTMARRMYRQMARRNLVPAG